MSPQRRRTQDSHQTARPQDSHQTARKVTRLEGFDYSSEGAYFVTHVTKNRERLFGEIINEEMVLSDFGRIVTEEWVRSAGIRKEIELGKFVIMPNHFHGIVHIFDITHSTGDRPNSSPSNDGAHAHPPGGAGKKVRQDGRAICRFFLSYNWSDNSISQESLNVIKDRPARPRNP